MVKYENDQKAAMLTTPEMRDRAAIHRAAISDFDSTPSAQYGSYGEYDMIYTYAMPNDKALAANLHLTDWYGLAKYSKAIPLMGSDDLVVSMKMADDTVISYVPAKWRASFKSIYFEVDTDT